MSRAASSASGSPITIEAAWSAGKPPASSSTVVVDASATPQKAFAGAASSVPSRWHITSVAESSEVISQVSSRSDTMAVRRTPITGLPRLSITVAMPRL